MNTTQIYNVLYYLEIMWSIEWKSTSPEYFKEKTKIFFNQLGKKENLSIPHKYSLWNDWLNNYCTIWNVDNTDYELINIIYFLITSIFENDSYSVKKEFKNIISNFKEYIGDTEKISKTNLYYLVHEKLRENLNYRINKDLQLKRLIKLTKINES